MRASGCETPLRATLGPFLGAQRRSHWRFPSCRRRRAPPSAPPTSAARAPQARQGRDGAARSSPHKSGSPLQSTAKDGADSLNAQPNGESRASNDSAFSHHAVWKQDWVTQARHRDDVRCGRLTARRRRSTSRRRRWWCRFVRGARLTGAGSRMLWCYAVHDSGHNRAIKFGQQQQHH